MPAPLRLAVVGHVEWCEFVQVEEMPAPGAIVHAGDRWEEAAGGGAVAAVQLARLAGGASLYTALGGDELGTLARDQLSGQGVTVHAATAAEPQRRAFVHLDGGGERTITVLGDKLRPSGGDGSLPWERLGDADGVFFVSGDVEALQQARRARILVATSRELPTLQAAGVELDALVGSGEDEGERYRPGDLEPAPKLVVTTAGPLGGWAQPGGPYRAAPLLAPPADAYGCGDCFAAGLTYGLAAGLEPEEAIELAARCGAAALTGRGPYPGMLAGPTA